MKAISRGFVFCVVSVALLCSCGLDVAGPNRPPQAVLEAQVETGPDLPALVDGGRSFDPDGDDLSYRWSVLHSPEDASGVFGPEQGPRTTFTPDGPGAYVIALVVSDGQLDSEPATARIQVAAACTQDAQCDDSDPCTTDRCVLGRCEHEDIPNCGDDLCPDDPDKTEPGQCGCGTPDTDSDSDGTADCLDNCPEDPEKTDPGICGCGVPDDDLTTDTDGDGVVDCNDPCHEDPDKVDPGVCGCGVPEDPTDSDADGTPDCIDACPDDPDKIEAGLCGCGVVDDPADADSDGTPDCVDGCPDDPDKTEPGACGCGVEELDADGDGSCDPDDCAPFNAQIHPGADERCNGLDDNCDGQRDEGACPCHVEELRGHVYLICDANSTWVDARNACLDQGFELVTVDDLPENDFLTELIRTILEDDDTWIGFNDRGMGNEGDWVWSSGGGTGFTHWEEHQPDNSWLSEDCGLFWSGHGGRWNDSNCNDEYSYICETDCGAGLDGDGDGWGDACDCAPMNPWIHPDAVEICNGKDDDCDGVIDGLEECPCTTVALAGHVYSFCSDEVDWISARDRCRAYGGDLVAVESDSEQTALEGGLNRYLEGEEAWMAYNDRDVEGDFTWSDGSPAGYEHWYTDEPNDADGNEDCAHFRGDGWWNDADCDATRAFICEYVPCPGDVFMDIDGDGVCGDTDTCPAMYNPAQEADCGDTTCLDLLQNAGVSRDGLYWISPPGVNFPMQVYCDMHREGGGWTLVAVYGTDGRPARWSVAAYPRPGAALYGSMSEAVMDPQRNDRFIGNASIPAAQIWEQSQGEILAWVGGMTDDYVTATLPMDCNYFDAAQLCFENDHGPFTLYDSAGNTVSNDTYACTTAHSMAGFESDPYDEFGLHLMDGQDDNPSYNCHQGSGGGGFQNVGRLFSSFEESGDSFWNGVHSYWDPDGDYNQPGALFVR